MIWHSLKQKMSAYAEKTIRSSGQVYTYNEILEVASTFGEGLSAQKYGILCERELHAVIALLACFSAGKTAVPMSYRYGESHCNKIIRQTDLSYIITDRNGELEIEQVSTESAEKENLDDIALIMSTSGTTGYPKCAMLSKANVLSNVESILDYFSISSTDTILIVRPIYHCAVLVGELLVSLMRGLNVVLYDHSFNPMEIFRLIEQENITVMCATPTVFTLLSKLSKRKLPLRILALSGEILTDIAQRALCHTFGNAEIFHVYGLTEAGPRVSYLPPELFGKTKPNVGVPIKDVQVKIADGELLVKSPSTMVGYYADQVATERVLKDGWLHTGDMAELIDGKIFIKGRKDNLMIRSGMNIYPQEIENELMACDCVTEVLAYPIVKDGASLKIGVQVVPNRETNIHEIRQYCISKLASYMVPDEIQIVSEIPKNGSGKKIRKKVIT